MIIGSVSHAVYKVRLFITGTTAVTATLTPGAPVPHVPPGLGLDVLLLNHEYLLAGAHIMVRTRLSPK